MIHRSETLTPFDIAWVAGIIGAFVIFAAGLGYVSWEYSHRRH